VIERDELRERLEVGHATVLADRGAPGPAVTETPRDDGYGHLLPSLDERLTVGLDEAYGKAKRAK
jgi:hypothetical protein